MASVLVRFDLAEEGVCVLDSPDVENGLGYFFGLSLLRVQVPLTSPLSEEGQMVSEHQILRSNHNQLFYILDSLLIPMLDKQDEADCEFRSEVAPLYRLVHVLLQQHQGCVVLLVLEVVHSEIQQHLGVLVVHFLQGIQAQNRLPGLLECRSQHPKIQNPIQVVGVILQDLQCRLHFLLEHLFQVPGIGVAAIDLQVVLQTLIEDLFVGLIGGVLENLLGPPLVPDHLVEVALRQDDFVPVHVPVLVGLTNLLCLGAPLKCDLVFSPSGCQEGLPNVHVHVQGVGLLCQVVELHALSKPKGVFVQDPEVQVESDQEGLLLNLLELLVLYREVRPFLDLLQSKLEEVLGVLFLFELALEDSYIVEEFGTDELVLSL